MPLSDKALRQELRELVSEAGRRKTDASDWVAFVGLGVAVAGSIAVVLIMSETSDLSWWIKALAAAVTLIVLFVGAVALDDPIAQRNAARAANRFRKRFPKDSGDYDRAIALLRGTRTDSEIEKDLLKTLGWDVAFADEGATELLGEFEKSGVTTPHMKSKSLPADDTPTPRGAEASKDPAPPGTARYIPLDPYEPSAKTVKEPRGPWEENDETTKNRQ